MEETCIVCGAVIPEGRQVCLNCEDRIKQGKLIDTERYFIIEDEEWGSRNKYLVCKHFIETMIEDFCATREEAEARLKELKGKGI